MTANTSDHGFELWSHVREILAETTEENLDSLCDLIFKRTCRSDYPTAYRQALDMVVRKELAHAPRLHQNGPDTQGEDVQPGTSSADDSAGGGQGPSDIQTLFTPSGGQNMRNSRAALFRRHRVRLSIWIGEKTYREIEKCTVAELEFAAAESDRLAEANAQAAIKYRRLIKVMTEHEVETVAELTDEQIEQVLGDE